MENKGENCNAQSPNTETSWCFCASEHFFSFNILINCMKWSNNKQYCFFPGCGESKGPNLRKLWNPSQTLWPVFNLRHVQLYLPLSLSVDFQNATQKFACPLHFGRQHQVHSSSVINDTAWLFWREQLGWSCNSHPFMDFLAHFQLFSG